MKLYYRAKFGVGRCNSLLENSFNGIRTTGHGGMTEEFSIVLSMYKSSKAKTVDNGTLYDVPFLVVLPKNHKAAVNEMGPRNVVRSVHILARSVLHIH